MVIGMEVDMLYIFHCTLALGRHQGMYGDWYGACMEICYMFYIVHLCWVHMRVCMVISTEYVR